MPHVRWFEQGNNDEGSLLVFVAAQDGSRIAFNSYRDDANSELYVMNADGSNVVRITTSTGSFDAYPAWSPDSLQLTFVSTRDGNEEIYVMNADGTNVRRLTDYSGTDTQPAWWPGGALILFSTNRDGNFELYLVKPHGGGLLRVTNAVNTDNYPAWSADGARFVWRRSSDLYVQNADMSIVRLTQNAGANSEPDWQ